MGHLILKKWTLCSYLFLVGGLLYIYVHWTGSFGRENNPVNIQLSSSGLPFFQVSIEGSDYPIVFDLGSDQELSIVSDAVESLNKTYCGIVEWINYKGLEFAYPKYTLPKIQIGSSEFKNVTLVTFPRERKKDSRIWENSDEEIPELETIGTLGRMFLEKMNVLIDVGASKIIFASSLKKLKSEGYHASSFIKIPFTQNEIGIILDVQTDLGNSKVLLDTGFTCTTFRSEFYPEKESDISYRYGLPTLITEKFSINNVTFSPQRLYFLQITEDIQGVDGFLGMDFIKKHVIYIDFVTKNLYIQK